MKPQRRWLTVSAASNPTIWLHHASAHGESMVAYLRRMCEHYGGPLASVGMRLVEIEVRVIKPKPGKRKETCSQCGEPFGASACGPTHASVAVENRQARKRKETK